MSLRVKTPLNGPRERSPAVSSYFTEHMAGVAGGTERCEACVRGLPGGWGPFLSSCPVCGSRPQESLAHEPPEAEWLVSPPWSAAGLMLPWPPGHPRPCARSDRGKRHQLWNSTEKPNSSVWRRSRVEERRGEGWEGRGRTEGLPWGWSPERRGGETVVWVFHTDRQTAHPSAAIQGFSEPGACRAQTQCGEGEGEDSLGQSRRGRDVTGITPVEHTGGRGWEGRLQASCAPGGCWADGRAGSS